MGEEVQGHPAGEPSDSAEEAAAKKAARLGAKWYAASTQTTASNRSPRAAASAPTPAASQHSTAELQSTGGAASTPTTSAAPRADQIRSDSPAPQPTSSTARVLAPTPAISPTRSAIAEHAAA